MITLLLALSAQSATLDEALALARAHAPVAAAARAQADAADAANREGRARLGPTLSADTTYTLNNYAVTFNADGATVVVQPLSYLSASAAIRQSLSPTAIAERRVGEVITQAARDDAEAAGRALTLSVVGAYYDALVAQEAVEVQQALLALSEAQQTLATSRQTHGLADDRASLQAALAVSRAKRELTGATAAVTAAQAGLRALLGRDLDGSLDWPAVPALPTAAERPDVRAAQGRVEAADRRVRGAWTRWMPELGAGLSYFWTQNIGFTGRPDLLRGDLAATWTIPASGALVYQRQVWAAEARGAAAELSRLQADADRQIAVARAELDRATAAAAAVTDEVALAERHHALTARAFEVGSATALEVDEALAQLRAARLAAVRERAQVEVATWTLVWALGG